MNLEEFINQFSHNNLIRLHYKAEGGHEQVLEDENAVAMDWEVPKGTGVYRHYAKNKVLGIASIFYLSGNYREAINIVIEKLENQPFVDDTMEHKNEINHSESIN